MLLKWLFTILAVLWLLQALRPYLGGTSGMHRQQPPPPPPPPPPSNKPDIQKRAQDDEGEYVDYEEVK